MAGLLSDARKTALGACGLAVLAILFAREGGVADTAVTGAQDIAGRKRAEIAAGAEAHKTAWFAADEKDYEVHAVAPPPAASGAEPRPQAERAAVHLPGPTGPDFPRGL